jgi:hypothetical protein
MVRHRRGAPSSTILHPFADTVSIMEDEMEQQERRDGDILAGYAEQAEFAKTNRISARTVVRYRNRPDGLPSVAFGGKIFIPIDEAMNWLKSQVRHPNRRRAG